MIWGILIFVLTLTIDLYTDIKRWYKGTIDHTRGALLRLIGLVPVVLFLGWYAIPLVGFTYMVLFNGLLNVFMNKGWWSLGTTAWTDKFFSRMKLWQYKAISIGGVAISLIFYIWMNKK